MEAGHKSIILPFEYVKSSSGKKVRTKLIKAFNYWFNVPQEIEEKIIEITEMLNNATLLIDDIEDGSVLRRGSPAAHLVFGVSATINSSNYYYFQVLKEIIKIAPKEKLAEAIQVYQNCMIDLHEGQGIEIYWRESQTLPTMSEYREMSTMKTTALFGLGLNLLKLFRKSDLNLDQLLDDLGFYYQVRNDYINLKSQEYIDWKTFAEDITEGKFSYTILDAMKKDPHNIIVLNILKLRTDNLDMKKLLVDYLEKVGAIEATYEEMERLHNLVKLEIEKLGGNPVFEKLVQDIVPKK